jgi:hypothetical protein
MREREIERVCYVPTGLFAPVARSATTRGTKMRRLVLAAPGQWQQKKKELQTSGLVGEMDRRMVLPQRSFPFPCLAMGSRALADHDKEMRNKER